jgi:hypothetical protein
MGILRNLGKALLLVSVIELAGILYFGYQRDNYLKKEIPESSKLVQVIDEEINITNRLKQNEPNVNSHLNYLTNTKEKLLSDPITSQGYEDYNLLKSYSNNCALCALGLTITGLGSYYFLKR